MGKQHTSTPHQHTSPAHLTSTPHQHTSPAHLTSTPHQHTSPAHLTSTPHQHTSPAHLTSTPHRHTSSARLTFYSRVPNITIATDIICGFPTETTSDFAQTLALVQHYQFPSLFINQFYPRPGTPAARLKRLPTQEVKRRSRELTTLFHSYQPYHRRLGQTMEVLVTEVSHDRQFLVGHNKSYEQVRQVTWESHGGHMVVM